MRGAAWAKGRAGGTECSRGSTSRARALHRWDGSHAVIELDAMVGCANPTEDGDVVLALADRIELLGTGEVLARFPHGPEVRANDGACDSDGRLWVGTLALAETPGAGSLYRLGGDGLTPILDGLTIANGIGWSPDGARMYYIDTPTRRIDAYVYDGELGERATFAEIDGFPDGLAVDDEGCVWVACLRRLARGAVDAGRRARPRARGARAEPDGVLLRRRVAVRDDRPRRGPRLRPRRGRDGTAGSAVPQDSAFGRRPDERSVAAEDAGRVRQLGRRPRGEPCGELVAVELDAE